MAKQIEDTQTIDMYHKPKKRGRPATGKAMTAAERKRRQRERDHAALHNSELDGGQPIEALTVTALLEGLAEAVSLRHKLTARQLADELVRRASLQK